MRRPRPQPLSKTDPRTFQHWLIFQRNLTPRNQSGGVAGWTPETVREERCLLEPLEQQGGEFQRADWSVSTNQYKVTMWRHGDITEDMRIVYNGRIFAIRQAPQVARSDRFMMLFCEENKA